MTKEEHIAYWENTSDKDAQTMENLVKSKGYHWALFIGHLVIEKLLKAYYVKFFENNPPYIHDLYRLAEKANLIVTEDHENFLDTVTTFNISARYPDVKEKFYRKCTKEFTEKYIGQIQDFRKWLKQKLRD